MINILFFLTDLFSSPLETLGKIFTAALFVGGAAYGLYHGVKRAKERGAKEERDRQDFITREVERQVTAHKVTYEERIAILKEALEAVKIVADFTARRLELQEQELREKNEEITELKTEMRKLKIEHDAAVSRAFQLQGQLDEILKARP